MLDVDCFIGVDWSNNQIACTIVFLNEVVDCDCLTLLATLTGVLEAYVLALFTNTIQYIVNIASLNLATNMTEFWKNVSNYTNVNIYKYILRRHRTAYT